MEENNQNASSAGASRHRQHVVWMVNNRSHRWGWRGLEVVVVVDGMRVVRGRRW